MFSALGFDDLVVRARSCATRRELANVDRVAARLRAYRGAGADGVAIVPSTAEDPEGPATLRALAGRCEL